MPEVQGSDNIGRVTRGSGFFSRTPLLFVRLTEVKFRAVRSHGSDAYAFDKTSGETVQVGLEGPAPLLT